MAPLVAETPVDPWLKYQMFPNFNLGSEKGT